MSPCASHNLPPRLQIPEVVVTNTLIITSLNHQKTFLPSNLSELRAHFEQHGKIYKFVPIKSFNRILVIFYQTNDAKTAKRYCDRVKFLDKIIRIYYGQHTPLYDENDNSRHLSVPKLERNWLSSPPCSPPVGWTQIREDRPNSNTLADDLVHALAHTSLNPNNNYNNDDVTIFSLNDGNNVPKMSAPILSVVPCDSSSRQSDVPLILVQDWDDSETKGPSLGYNIQQNKALYPTLIQRPPTPTSRPPLIF